MNNRERGIAAVRRVESDRLRRFALCSLGSRLVSLLRRLSGSISSSSAGLFSFKEKVARRLSQSHLPKVMNRAPRVKRLL